MTPDKYIVNAEVRALLVELDDAMEAYHSGTRILADRSISNSVAVDTGAEREHVRARIVGIAYRIHQASAPWRYGRGAKR